MMFETRMTRQTIPSVPAREGEFHVFGTSMVGLKPPDDGDWRFRDMQMIPAFQAESVRYVGPDQAMSPARFQPTEVLVVWERYKESE